MWWHDKSRCRNTLVSSRPHCSPNGHFRSDGKTTAPAHEKSDPIRAAQTSSDQSSDSRGTSHGPALAAGASSINSARTAPATKKHGQKRAGAKTVKRMEQESAEYKLSSEGATSLRALSARGNFLSQDRADINDATKELCREFAIPNRNSQ